MRLSTKFGLSGFALVSAIALALLSLQVERVGPELAQYGNLCGPRADEPCYRPVLKAGVPVAFLLDRPGVSIERQLGLEDKVLLGALVLDIALYFAIVLLGLLAVWRRRSTRTHAGKRAAR